MKKFYMLMSIFMVILLMMVGCSGSGNNQTEDPAPSEEEIVLTLEELAEYNGADGNPAYIAVDGIIYDVTDSAMWSGGEHNGFEAGRDLTEEIKTISPHGISVLDRIPEVGRIEE